MKQVSKSTFDTLYDMFMVRQEPSAWSHNPSDGPGLTLAQLISDATEEKASLNAAISVAKEEQLNLKEALVPAISDAQEEQLRLNAPEIKTQWYKKPSVGTWMGPPRRLDTEKSNVTTCSATEVVANTSAISSGPRRLASEESVVTTCSATEVVTNTSATSFARNQRPSVSTWMKPRRLPPGKNL
jgi:hypothetical protein